jgi:hypothetical protein
VTDHATIQSVLDLAIRISQVLETHRYAAGKEQSLRERLESVGLHDARDVTRGVRKRLLSEGVYPDPDEVAGLLRECLLVLAGLYPVVGDLLTDCHWELLPPGWVSHGSLGVKLYRGETPGAPGPSG